MADREADERLADWRVAEREEAGTADGSVEQRRAVATTRRARWKSEDASRAADRADGGPAETTGQTSARSLERLAEASTAASKLHPDARDINPGQETFEQEGKRLGDEAEIARELPD